jgi:hypothetical protein
MGNQQGAPSHRQRQLAEIEASQLRDLRRRVAADRYELTQTPPSASTSSAPGLRSERHIHRATAAGRSTSTTIHHHQNKSSHTPTAAVLPFSQQGMLEMSVDDMELMDVKDDADDAAGLLFTPRSGESGQQVPPSYPLQLTNHQPPASSVTTSVGGTRPCSMDAPSPQSSQWTVGPTPTGRSSVSSSAHPPLSRSDSGVKGGLRGVGGSVSVSDSHLISMAINPLARRTW